MKIGFAGLGVMGGPMARHLVQAGHEVAGFNRSPDKARAWSEITGGLFAGTVAEAASGAELLILCVGNDDDVRQVVGEALPHLADGAVVVDHTTTSARVAREMADLAARADLAAIPPVMALVARVVLAVPVVMVPPDPVSFPASQAEQEPRAAPVVRVALAEMRCRPTEMAARVVWAVMPAVVVPAVTVDPVQMPAAAMRLRRAATVVLERAVVLAAGVAQAVTPVPQASMAVAVPVVRPVTPGRVAMAPTAAMARALIPMVQQVVMAAIPAARV